MESRLLYRYYVSDITRMWPVNGKYAASQRELLGFVLAYRNTVMQRIHPGVTPAQILEEAKAAMQPIFASTKFSKPAYEAAAHKLVDTGGGIFSHPVGLAVHDDGDYMPGPLAPGQVFSIDPQLRVPEEDLYYRYEDVIAITPGGYENFTDFLPTKLERHRKIGGTGRRGSESASRWCRQEVIPSLLDIFPESKLRVRCGGLGPGDAEPIEPGSRNELCLG